MAWRSSEIFSRRLQDLESESFRTRAKALRWLGRLDVDSLMECASPLTNCLRDENWKVRLAAAEVLGKLQHLAISTQALVRLLSDDHWQVRHTTVVALGNLRPDTLRECAKTIAYRLEDSDWRVRVVTLEVLAKLEPEALVAYLGEISGLLTDQYGAVRKQVVEVLREPLMRELVCRTGLPTSPSSASTAVYDPVASAELQEARAEATLPLTELLDELPGAQQSVLLPSAEENGDKEEPDDAIEGSCTGDSGGQTCVENALDPGETSCSEAPSVVAESGASPQEEEGEAPPTSGGEDDLADNRTRLGVARSSSAPSPQLQRWKGEVVRMLCALFLRGKAGLYEILAAVCTEIDFDVLGKAFRTVADEAHNTTLMNMASEHGCVEVVRFLVRTCHTLVHSKNICSETPLHVAAREGHLDVCQVLVGAGALTKVKNNRRMTPTELAQLRGHQAVVSFLESRENMTTVRGGTGDALEEAMQETRPIKKVEWFKIALPGFAGRVGAYHSLLTVTVGTAEESHSYVIEKAALARSAGEEDAERAKNGVHVSHWLDVVPNIEYDPLYTLDAAGIENNTGTPDLSLAALRDIAVKLGPYNVATCNCHHAALAVYNACAKPDRRVPRIPNAALVLGARFLQGVGVDVANSESAVSNSASTAQLTSKSASTSMAATSGSVSTGSGGGSCNTSTSCGESDSTRVEADDENTESGLTCDA